MRWVLLVAVVVCVGLVYASMASGHQSGCHAAYSCPSDHHTYVWYDSLGRGNDCAQPGADEYNPAIDTVVVEYDGRTYYCHFVGPYALPTPTPTPTATPTPTPATPRLSTLKMLRAKVLVRRMFSRRFRSWKAGYAHRVRACARVSRLRIRCAKVSWVVGDISYLGRAVIWRDDDGAWGSYTVRETNEYCVFVTHRGNPGRCVKTLRKQALHLSGF